ncbi:MULTISPECIES: cbb3-type cytochrome oxidase assembly protein CcoS [Methyloversatilis]|jgi:cbb3-type cytochrome oxidase maturation protein|uniref:cbb3-type cytochrome oxidase assembly protein CcoS n=1 Tax=Methyloversatilis TaxID=378210 RepID=UPI000368DEDA|nr:MULTISPECIES: cbb3-type cytochrome oxidase assembly protein CcoS [Methyloversatilis]MCR6667914.1 cbb3-type cytochrome oxidase assembly protein CcoS [Methyloversatilis sp.]PZU55152.1 MAG: cbb3-type cytochrome oxidase assembly protein CcoS [Thauera sp.]
MDILWLLVPMSVLIALGIGAVFIWSARSGQFDDLEGPAHRMLMDDDRAQTIDEAPETGRDERKV